MMQFKFHKNNNSKGFTLIELLIAMAISSIVIAALYQTFDSQQKSYLVQEEVATMQQSGRAAMMFLTNDIRMAGYDKFLTGNFGIVSVQSRDTSNTAETDGFKGLYDNTFAGNSSLVLTADLDDDGALDSEETFQYQIFDHVAGDGHVDLARRVGASTTPLLAENVQKMGLAYAFDDDLNGQLDTYNAGGTQQIIWAVDTDGDNMLDTNLDTNGDGVIDFSDGPGGIDTLIAGTALTTPVSVNRIRAVRVWILLQTNQADSSFNGNAVYTAGQYIVRQAPNRRMRLITTTINCRNLGI
ncbi:MAG: prepilin-type N-terminal cleavage/methylation domain-containing protein [Proteobacteria bacterium]|nr:prepilin-type N-terminal cleavage/methylation domain-containing protein [Pseudomonadota bacterium]MBU1386968.1 prepilin-type N-terminal cleavage/methylation domain-containing protein [Pseudomonadota bacterium]MBU1542351.1 prepilin-type N-terminal cleavage/methylation domain-containing protein [Pseudomonadota bacterium]MBU2480322.1 prepilin-type N-terminal cleavage/methylation domain-containing protein [Pseudomonadota bacterium]